MCTRKCSRLQELLSVYLEDARRVRSLWDEYGMPSVIAVNDTLLQPARAAVHFHMLFAVLTLLFAHHGCALNCRAHSFTDCWLRAKHEIYDAQIHRIILNAITKT